MRSWGLLFGIVTALCVACFAYSPLNGALWLPGYEETNAKAIAELRGLETSGSEAESALRAAIDAAGKGNSVALAARLDDARTAVGSMSVRMEQLVAGQFLDARVRSLRSRRATLASDLEAATASAAAGLSEATRSALERALASASLLREETTAALDEVAGPTAQPPSTAAQGIDHLFVLILWITGVTFVLTMGVLVWTTYRFAARPGRVAFYSHGSLPVEIGLAAVTAILLAFITVYQYEDWASLKFRDRKPDGPALAHVTGYQFGWKIRYAGPDGALDTGDDLVRHNDLHFVKGEPTLIDLDSADVIHSFSMPQLRIKQDAMPGLKIPVWFDAARAGRYELLCAELCGWGHYKMRADVVVHETRAEFDEWQAAALRDQNRDQPDDPEAE